jgi:hypothetical protein
MVSYSLWLVGASDRDDAANGAPVDLSAQTLAQARVEARCVWMETVAEGLRVYDNVSGALVYEVRPGRPC